jgi:hypothetical protein
MTPERAKEIANQLHAKWVSDEKDDGTYTLRLNAEETEELFADIARELEHADARRPVQMLD